MFVSLKPLVICIAVSVVKLDNSLFHDIVQRKFDLVGKGMGVSALLSVSHGSIPIGYEYMGAL